MKTSRGTIRLILATMLTGDDATSAVVYSCGPPAMLEAVRALCEEHGVAYQLAEETPMACGFGACFGCATPEDAIKNAMAALAHFIRLLRPTMKPSRCRSRHRSHLFALEFVHAFAA